MSNYFEKYTSNDKPDIVLYKDILLDLIKEVEVNYVALIEQSTDILNIEYTVAQRRGFIYFKSEFPRGDRRGLLKTKSCYSAGGKK